MTAALAATPDGVRITLHIQPRAARTEMVGPFGDALKLRVAAPPVDGAANEAIVTFLANRLGVPRRDVAIVAGHGGRRKTVVVTGVDVARVAAVLVAADLTPP